jgi:hypothetical protein
MTKSKRKRWTEHVAYREDKKIANKILTATQKGRDHLEDLHR